MTARAAPRAVARGPSRTAAALAAGLALIACQRRAAPPPPPAGLAAGEVPRVRAPITVDGELHERDWNERARVAAFTTSGPEGRGVREARPFSQIRLLRDADTLYLGLYAADQDIRSTDAFTLALGTLTLSIDPRGRVTPPVAGLRVAAEIDDTIDDPRDEDEEWVIEAALPIAAIPPGTTTIHAARCDTPKDGKQRCGAWDGPIALAPTAAPPVP